MVWPGGYRFFIHRRLLESETDASCKVQLFIYSPHHQYQSTQAPFQPWLTRIPSTLLFGPRRSQESLLPWRPATWLPLSSSSQASSSSTCLSITLSLILFSPCFVSLALITIIMTCSQDSTCLVRQHWSTPVRWFGMEQHRVASPWVSL